MTSREGGEKGKTAATTPLDLLILYKPPLGLQHWAIDYAAQRGFITPEISRYYYSYCCCCCYYYCCVSLFPRPFFFPLCILYGQIFVLTRPDVRELQPEPSEQRKESLIIREKKGKLCLIYCRRLRPWTTNYPRFIQGPSIHLVKLGKEK